MATTKMTELNDFIIGQLKNKRFQKEYLNECLAEYAKDDDFRAFFHSLELVIRSRDSVSGFCQKAGIDRTMFYQVIKGKRVPKMNTMYKILDALGYRLKIA